MAATKKEVERGSRNHQWFDLGKFPGSRHLDGGCSRDGKGNGGGIKVVELCLSYVHAKGIIGSFIQYY